MNLKMEISERKYFEKIDRFNNKRAERYGCKSILNILGSKIVNCKLNRKKVSLPSQSHISNTANCKNGITIKGKCFNPIGCLFCEQLVLSHFLNKELNDKFRKESGLIV